MTDLKLRPHHVGSLQNIIYCQQAMNENPPNPNNVKWAKKEMSLIRKIYGEKMLKQVNALAKQIISSPSTKITIVRGFDDICNNCPLLETCKRKIPLEINELAAKLGYIIKEDDTDELAIKDLGISYGMTYYAREIFEKYSFNLPNIS